MANIFPSPVNALTSVSAAGNGSFETAFNTSNASFEAPFNTGNSSFETAFSTGKINFTTQEKLMFLDMIDFYKNTIESKLYDNMMLEKKDRAWRDMADTFNTKSRTGPRTPKQLKALWKNMKAKARLDAKRRGVTTDSLATLDDVAMGQISRKVISILLSVNEGNSLDDVLSMSALDAAAGVNATSHGVNATSHGVNAASHALDDGSLQLHGLESHQVSRQIHKWDSFIFN